MPTLYGLLGTCGIIALIITARKIRAIHDDDMSRIQSDERLSNILIYAGWPAVDATLPPAGSRQGEGRESRQVSGGPASVHGRGEL